MRRDATRTSQPNGLSGTPCAGHWAAAATSASCTASSASAKCPYRRKTATRARGASPQQALDAVLLVHTSGSGALMIWRTSMRWRIGAPPSPGAAEASAAIARARSRLSTSTIR